MEATCPKGEPDCVSSTVWPWRQRVVALDATGNLMRIRRRAILQAMIMAAVGCLLFRFQHRIGGIGVTLLATLVLTIGCLKPSVFLAFERFGRRLGHGVGLGMTWFLLVPFYYLCFVPGRILLLLARRDPMNRQFPSRSTTLWTPRPSVRNPSQYRKQF